MRKIKFTNLSQTRLIFLHAALWVCFLFFPLLIYKVDFFNVRFFRRDLLNNAFLIGLFYLNFYLLIPAFFERKKFTLYFSFAFGCLVLFSLMQLLIEYYFFPFDGMHPAFSPGVHIHHAPGYDSMTANNAPHGYDTSFAGNHQHGEAAVSRSHSFFNMPAFFYIEGLRKALLSVFTILFTGSFIRVALQWFKTEQKNEELEIKRLNVELDFLKAQINPHFLFNTLNTVYSLAHKQSPETEIVILKLSDILRYVIYESSAKEVWLSHELNYINNYIELQQYRLDKTFDIKYNQTGDAGSLVIEPMLLIPFIENAFKHGISYKPGAFILIKIEIKNKALNLHVSNTYKEDAEGRAGIGLNNVMKRLQLAYTGRHELTLVKQNGIYLVNLKIILDDNQVPDSR